MSSELFKPIIGLTCGDLNGIGLETVIKAVSDNHIFNICTPVIFANNKSVNFYKKTIHESNFSFNIIKDFNKLSNKQVNIFNIWEEDVNINPGEESSIAGSYALKSLQNAIDEIKSGIIDAIVTAPINKNSIHSEAFPYTGHTPFLRDTFEVEDVVMLMCAENMRVAVVTEHVPVQDIVKELSVKKIVSKLKIINQSLKEDFGITKPKIAVLGLNPHAGDHGLIGNEEETLIKPAIKEAKQNNILAFGPYPADGFFAHGQYAQFDAVLAMYHDQGLIPFKSLAIGEGVNYTAGLPIVRTSPDHGTAFDIAGKGIADGQSTLEAIFLAVDIVRSRRQNEEDKANPLRKMSERILGNVVDERISE
ncbi:MAG: 4-hydroxythreonine-4-phosphate dehydrogenase PdxA [Pseudopedobacter saltans]|uniref:4-hydroxythreonine-4-phosphate dehydrogenase PdxA n=1 Tax=Pseudopedobacter saltans TaxID=151895 RepID=A0A2W5FE00_9SPHI|nr:MAG: 4-hydroxythreonine-4-phosphate dehydrogenase PdxA [Pseudopedobacter saltans]